MDKWKELELNKMKSGGNNQAKEFLEAQSDWKAGGNISANYNSKAAALYRDKVTEDLTKIPNNIFAFADILWGKRGVVERRDIFCQEPQVVSLGFLRHVVAPLIEIKWREGGRGDEGDGDKSLSLSGRMLEYKLVQYHLEFRKPGQIYHQVDLWYCE